MADKALMNIACDDIATATNAAVLSGSSSPAGPILDLPYAGALAMLKIKQIWITLKPKEALYRARRTKPMQIYCH